ncbi:MAG: dihydroorotase [Clostridia bacterium]|nr:dihydroorotase [Clostridia bacterium]
MTKKADNLTIFRMEALESFSPCVEEVSLPSDGNFVVFPGFCDVHVHLREPGFSYKETMKSGTLASAHGGFTAVCPMPNLKPVPDSAENLKVQLDIIEKDACIHVYPYGALTVGEQGEVPADLEAMAKDAIAFSDDGKGIQSEEMMRSLMLKAKALGKMVVAHCEVNDLLHGGYIHDGEYAKAHGHRGICSESEWAQIERDCRLAEETGCAYHVCHISTKESVDIIRKAKARGVNGTCETGPHYLIMDDSMLEEDGKFKMNPPIRSKEDKEALLEGLLDGTIDIVATDHAPHSEEEKSRGLEKSAFGITGIETCFPLMYTHLVKPGVISLEKLIELIAVNPRKRFGIPLENGDYTIWDLEKKIKVTKEWFLSEGKASPFENKELYGCCVKTVCGSKAVYSLEV